MQCSVNSCNLPLLQHPRNQYTHASKKVSQRTIKKQQSTQTSSSRPNGPEYQMRIGPLADPNGTPPTQTAWVDPQTAGWTKMTYSDTKETYDDSGN